MARCLICLCLELVDFCHQAVEAFVLFTRDVVGSVGFSGKPLDVAVGLDLAGVITGAEIVEHHEPILIIGVAPADLDAFAAQFRGIDIRATPGFEAVSTADRPHLDAVSGATVSPVTRRSSGKR